MSLKLGTTDIAGIATNTKYNAHNLLDFKWADHIIDDISWLRADTFSWQDGNVYTEVYNLLSTSIQGATETTEQGVTFYECSNGLRIALADQENTILNLYNTTGVAWYYILDTTNQRFKLPRTKYGFVGLRDEVGKYVPESLPNITAGTITISDWGGQETQVTGAWGGNVLPQSTNLNGGTSATEYVLNFDASRSSSIYQNNAPVQERATQMYLYFYVGEYSQTAIEQTAGITAEQLNAKQDVCTHIIETYVNGASGYRIWSDGYCEQWGHYTHDNVQKPVTISYIKTFNNANYDLQITKELGSASDSAMNYIYMPAYVLGSKRIDSFATVMTAANRLQGFDWKACGYLAEGEY